MNPLDETADDSSASAAARRVDGLEAVIAALTEVIGGTSRHLFLEAQCLDPRLWDAHAVLDALRHFATGRRQREVRILVAQPDDLPRENGGLLDLSQRLPTVFQWRQPEPEHATTVLHAAALLGDTGAGLWLDSGGRLGGEYEPAPSARARHARQRLEVAFDRARPLSELRALGL